MYINKKPEMVIRMHDVEIYRGNIAPISVTVDNKDLLRLDAVAGMLTEDIICKLVEQATKTGTIRVHPRAVKEF